MTSTIFVCVPGDPFGKQSLRANSRRYVWLRDNHIGDNPESINLDPRSRPGLNSAIDAAMGNGEQS